MQKSSSTALDCKYFVILHDTRFRFLDYTDTHIPSCLFITRNIFKKDIQRHSKENTNLKSCIISSSYCLWPCSLAVPVLAGWVYGFCCSMSRNTRRLNRQWSHPTDWEKPGGGGGGGGGGYSHFFCIRRLGPSICPSPHKNIRNFKHPKKIFEILATKKRSPILYLDLKKRP